jgi:hypothetical protein
MSGAINNGRRLQVSFGSYSGPAGVVERAGETQIAFAAKRRDVASATTGTIDGKPYQVLSMAQSEHVPGMLVLTVTAVTPETP